MVFYHGSSDALPIKNIILPASRTGVLREDFRKKLNNKVFFTDSLMSAEKFAKKAAAKYGGNPIVYEVKPIGQVFHPNTNEYIADKAKVVKIVGNNN